MKLLPHKFCELLPAMSKAEFEALAEDIAANGQHDDIVLFEGKILDGRHRNEVMEAMGKKPRTVLFKGTEAEALAFVCSRSIHRNMSTGQKVWAACNFHPYYEAEADQRRRANGGDKKSDGAKLHSPIGPQNPVKGKATEFAGRKFGVSARSVADGLSIKRASETEFARLGTGEKTLAQLKGIVRRIAKRRHLAARAELAPTTGEAEIITGDFRQTMPNLPGGKIRLIFADPPYNIGKDYGPGKKGDRLKPAVYRAMMEVCLAECHRLLTPDGALWLMINDEWVSELDLLLRNDLGFHRRRWVKWYETFGTCQTANHNFSCCSRHLLYCVKNEEDFVFNDDEFMVKSARETRYRDKRAAAGGKVMDDVWEISRLAGTMSERVAGIGKEPPTQLPLDLVGKIVRGCSEPGDTVFDPFTGTGTTAVAAVTSGRKFIGTELEKPNAEAARLRVRAALAETQKRAG